MFDKDKQSKKEKMSREEAFDKIEKWVDETRSRVYGDDLKELQDLLWVAIVDERLTMDSDETRKFTYVLEEPIVKKDDSGKISMFKISKVSQSEVLEFEKYKTLSAKTDSMLKTFCKDSEGVSIPAGFISRIDPRDSVAIQAVINAFFL